VRGSLRAPSSRCSSLPGREDRQRLASVGQERAVGKEQRGRISGGHRHPMLAPERRRAMTGPENWKCAPSRKT